MIVNNIEKVSAEHLKRDVYLYIRQSSLKQVLENTESTKRQYDLRERAIALGWSPEQVVVIDSDLGESAAPGAADRAGFERLVAEVSMGRVGLVMGLEVSRLARSCSAWHRLLEICSVTNTLVLDQDGLYDVAHINDRLLLGLKAAMSEAELHIIRERMRGGALSKASRGELRVRLPVGFVYDQQNRVVLDPDQQVRDALSLFFKTYRRLGTSYKTVQYFREQDLKFPKRIQCGPTRGDLVWGPLTVGRASQVLHNPRYAGAYAYGRSKTATGPEGLSVSRDLPVDQWHTLIFDAHASYITWEEFKRNIDQLEGNAYGPRHGSPPREGPALLQGLAVCGLCGQRMSVRYRISGGVQYPQYVCDGRNRAAAMPKCQSIPGQTIDEAVSGLLLETVEPMALEVSLAVHEQLLQQVEEADKLRCRQVERARYEVDLARRRYMEVDPANRLVAAELEAEWNRTLRSLQQAEEERERQRERDHAVIDDEKREKILSLSRDFPALWRNPMTPHRERKRMAALLIEDVALIKNGQLSVNVRFKGGATRSLKLPRPLAAYEQWTTSKEVVKEIDRLLEDCTYGEIAEILNEKGYDSGKGLQFDRRRISVIRRAYGLKDRKARLRAQGYLTAEELAPRLGTTRRMVGVKRVNGTLPVGGKKISDNGDYMYENPDVEKHFEKSRMSERTENE